MSKIRKRWGFCKRPKWILSRDTISVFRLQGFKTTRSRKGPKGRERSDVRSLRIPRMSILGKIGRMKADPGDVFQQMFQYFL